MRNRLIKIVFVILLLPNVAWSNTQFFSEGLSLFNNKKYNEAKFKFEQDIVFNPKK